MGNPELIFATCCIGPVLIPIIGRLALLNPSFHHRIFERQAQMRAAILINKATLGHPRITDSQTALVQLHNRDLRSRLNVSRIIFGNITNEHPHTTSRTNDKYGIQ